MYEGSHPSYHHSHSSLVLCCIVLYVNIGLMPRCDRRNEENITSWNRSSRKAADTLEHLQRETNSLERQEEREFYRVYLYCFVSKRTLVVIFFVLSVHTGLCLRVRCTCVVCAPSVAGVMLSCLRWHVVMRARVRVALDGVNCTLGGDAAALGRHVAGVKEHALIRGEDIDFKLSASQGPRNAQVSTFFGQCNMILPLFNVN